MIDRKAINPKVAAGLIGGSGFSVLAGLVMALATEDWQRALEVFIVSILPVLVSFGVAWYKLDPQREALLKRFEEQLKASSVKKAK